MIDQHEIFTRDQKPTLFGARVKNSVRFASHLDFAKQAAPEQIATALLRRDIRTEQKERKRRWNKKFDIRNQDAYEEDLASIILTMFPTEVSFTEKQKLSQGIYIIRFDMRMLNYFNSLSQGHQAGDAYKKGVAQIMDDKSGKLGEWLEQEGIAYNAYLVGGDEFAIIASTESEKARQLAEKLQMEIATMKFPEDSLVKPSVDFGIASIDEVVGEFNTIVQQSGFQGDDESRRTKLWQFVDSIADRRAEVNKYFNRIQFLGEAYKQMEFKQLERLLGFATRGAFQISSSELDAIMGSDEETKKWVSSVFNQRDNNAKLRILDPYQLGVIDYLNRISNL